jgi:hypothetical protein
MPNATVPPVMPLVGAWRAASATSLSCFQRVGREQSSRLPNPIPGLRTNAVRMAERGVQLVVPDHEPRLRTNTFRMTERGVQLVPSDREPWLRTNTFRMTEVGI